MKKKKSLILISSCMLLSLFVGMGVSNKTSVAKAAEIKSLDVNLANGKFANGTITWTELNGGIVIHQYKGTSSTAVNQNYISAPRVYKGHYLSFVTNDSYRITDVTLTYSDTYQGNSITASDTIDVNKVTNNTSKITATIATTTGGSHLFQAVDSTNGLSSMYIQNTASDSNVQLRPTAIKVSYFEVGSEAPTSYIVTFDSNGGTEIANQELIIGDSNVYAEQPTNPTKDGYDFKGWYTSNTFDSEAFNFATPITSNLTLYAKWEEHVDENQTLLVLNRNKLVSTTGAKYEAFTEKTIDNELTFAGNMAGSNGSMQLRTNNSNSGIVVTNSLNNKLIKKLSVKWNNETADGRKIQIYGKNTAYEAATDLFDTAKHGTLIGELAKGEELLNVAENYKFIGIRSSNGALYLDEIKLYLEEEIVTPSITITSDLEDNSVYKYSDNTMINLSLTASVNVKNYTIDWVTSSDAVSLLFDGLECIVSSESNGESIVKAIITVDGHEYESNSITVNSYIGSVLAEPSNFNINETSLTWDSVDNADYYIVEYMNSTTEYMSEEYKVETNSFDISSLEQGEYDFSIQAFSNSKLYKQSLAATYNTNIVLSNAKIIENTSTKGLLGFKFSQKEIDVVKEAKNTGNLKSEPTGNFASHLGLDQNKFSVELIKHDAIGTIFNNDANEIRMYGNASNNGCELVFKTLDGSVIDSIDITFGSKGSSYKLNGVEMNAVVNGTSGALSINKDSFSIQNVGGTTQLIIKSINIKLKEKADSYSNIRMRFVAKIEKAAVDSLGTITDAGVKVTAAGKESAMYIKVDPSIIGTIEEHGTQYYTFIGTVKNIPVTAKDLVLTANAYVVINEKTYNLKSTSYSLNSMVEEYLTTEGLLNAEQTELMNNFKNYLMAN